MQIRISEVANVENFSFFKVFMCFLVHVDVVISFLVYYS